VNYLRSLFPRECFPTKDDALACFFGYLAFMVLCWAVALPHGWNS